MFMKAQASEKFRNQSSFVMKRSPFEFPELLHPLSVSWARSPSEARSGRRLVVGDECEGGSESLELKRNAERGPRDATNDGVMHRCALTRTHGWKSNRCRKTENCILMFESVLQALECSFQFSMLSHVLN